MTRQTGICPACGARAQLNGAGLVMAHRPGRRGTATGPLIDSGLCLPRPQVEPKPGSIRPYGLRDPGVPWRVQGDRPVLTGDAGSFDEVSVGGWLHVERMDARGFFVAIGDLAFHVRVERDGSVTFGQPWRTDDRQWALGEATRWQEIANGADGDR